MAKLALVTAALLAAQTQIQIQTHQAAIQAEAEAEAVAAAALSGELGAPLIDARRSLVALESSRVDLPAPPLRELLMAQATPEVLQGFDTVLLTQINALFGSENLPTANGATVEPGLYVTASPQELQLFDQKLLDLQDGVVPPGPASRECKSGCKAVLWAGFRRVWLTTLEEAQLLAVEVPSRVVFGLEASVPGKTLVELAYAAAETRPGVPPNFSLLVNGGNAGLRARPFYLLPPGGVRVAPGDSALGLRVTLGAGESFEISAAHPRFTPKITGTGWKDLAAELAKVKKRYPNKGAIIIDVGEGTVGDVVMVMVAAQKHFAEAVLTDGVPVKWG
ncbi:hypothetical protein G6O69_12365 [Pseudenhygromyxa sp. WMMC2535]|uniref:hypothetical protein n=1 Tax=Pseudenhygromyxa sp. WMMC2535 TaxID=2712867 RepID=UPI001552785F|nr:hypothetical protein [Pseudenhygromyxa sp. WMMC2535]NVB38626.1 hypothetical protein [Pseudenhygromyxa sp. WMMC2535]